MIGTLRVNIFDSGWFTTHYALNNAPRFLNCNTPRAFNKVNTVLDRGIKNEKNITPPICHNKLTVSIVYLSTDTINCYMLHNRTHRTHQADACVRCVQNEDADQLLLFPI